MNEQIPDYQLEPYTHKTPMANKFVQHNTSASHRVSL